MTIRRRIGRASLTRSYQHKPRSSIGRVSLGAYDSPQGYLLIGGSSKRMGMDKRLLPYGDSTILERMIVLVQESTGKPPILVGDDIPNLLSSKLLRLPDALPNCGPLGGLVSALEHLQKGSISLHACDSPPCLRNEWAVILASDLPLLKVSDLTFLFQQANDDFDIITFSQDGILLEPLAALYHRRTLPFWKKNLHENQLSINWNLKYLKVRIIRPISGKNALLNINNQSDWVKLNKILSGRTE